MPTSIANVDQYNTSMKKTLLDKCFFIDKVDADCAVDFGCADGELIRFLRSLFPEKTYIGYDESPKMIVEANVKNVETPDVWFFDDWDVVDKALDVYREKGMKTVLNLSSVIHEVYAYATQHQIDCFWDQVFQSGFDFVAIRDMMPSRNVDRRSDINDVVRVYQRANLSHLRHFESVWGSIESNKSLLHFLLKYRYVENWDREVMENYLPLHREDMLSIISRGYRIIYEEHFTLPFLQWQVQRDFGIDVKDRTHIKMILQRQ